MQCRRAGTETAMRRSPVVACELRGRDETSGDHWVAADERRVAQDETNEEPETEEPP